MTDFRIWFIAKYILDKKSRGCADIEEVCRLANISTEYLKRRIKTTPLFRIGDNNLYYLSKLKIAEGKILELYRNDVRAEKITRNFLWNLASNKDFMAYITKCYAEHHKRKVKIGGNKYITIRGVVSLENISEYLKISKNTVISNLKRARAKKKTNIKKYSNHRFRSITEFRNWLLNNMNEEIDGEKISDNPRSYYITKYSKTEYCLTKRLPNIYEFTGTHLPGCKKGSSEKLSY